MKLLIKMETEHGDAVNPGPPGARPREPAWQLLGSSFPRMPPVEVREVDDAVLVVTSEAESSRGLVVQVTSPSPQNPIHRAFRALRAIGIQIAHARVWLEHGSTVQVLQLSELDDRQPAPCRVPLVLEALRKACKLPRRREGEPLFPGPTSTAARQSARTLLVAARR